MALYYCTGLESITYTGLTTEWNEVLKLNQMSVLAHNGVGKAYFHAGHYEEAMEHFEVAGNRTYYSEAFWEVRNVAIQKVLPYIFGAVVVLMIAAKIVSLLDKKKRIKQWKADISDRISRIPVLKDFQYAAKVCKSPMNRYYDIRRHRKGSVGGATVIYAVFFLVYMIYQTSKGFIYQYVAIEDMDIGGIVAGFFLLLRCHILNFGEDGHCLTTVMDTLKIVIVQLRIVREQCRQHALNGEAATHSAVIVIPGLERSQQILDIGSDIQQMIR